MSYHSDTWHPGPPTKEGIFWFVVPTLGMDDFVFVLQCKKYEGKLSIHLFGEHGSGPLDCYYRSSMFDRVKHARIDMTNDWKSAKNIPDDCHHMWVQDKDGNSGMCQLKRHCGSSGYYMRGTVAWAYGKGGSDHGIDLGNGYLFSPVKIPRI